MRVAMRFEFFEQFEVFIRVMRFVARGDHRLGFPIIRCIRGLYEVVLIKCRSTLHHRRIVPCDSWNSLRAGTSLRVVECRSTPLLNRSDSCTNRVLSVELNTELATGFSYAVNNRGIIKASLVLRLTQKVPGLTDRMEVRFTDRVDTERVDALLVALSFGMRHLRQRYVPLLPA